MLLADWFAEHGLLDGEGRPTASASLLNQSERLSNELRQRLGLDPRSESELVSAQSDAARNVTNLDELRARGRAALKARRERDRLSETVDALDAGEESQ